MTQTVNSPENRSLSVESFNAAKAALHAARQAYGEARHQVAQQLIPTGSLLVIYDSAHANKIFIVKKAYMHLQYDDSFLVDAFGFSPDSTSKDMLIIKRKRIIISQDDLENYKVRVLPSLTDAAHANLSCELESLCNKVTDLAFALSQFHIK